jgi:hypothetical protein
MFVETLYATSLQADIRLKNRQLNVSRLFF